MPEPADIDGRLPPGVRLLNVYLIPEEFNEILTLNNYYSPQRQLSNGSIKTKSKKRIELRNFFSDAPSSDELSTVTEESMETANSRSQSVSPHMSDRCSDQDQVRRWCDSFDNDVGFEHDENDNIIDDDSGQSERSEATSASELFGYNALSVLKEVAKRSFLSSNNKLRQSFSSDFAKEKFSSTRKCLRKSRSFTDSEGCIESSDGHKNDSWSIRSNKMNETDKGTQKQTQIRRTRSETTISISYRLNNKNSSHSKCKSEVMSEDSSYYSNEPSPTLGRKHWKNEDDLTTADERNHWQESVQDVLLTSNPKKNEELQVVSPIVPDSKPPLRRRLSTIMGPQIQKLKTCPKSFAMNEQGQRSEGLVIIGNNISEKISWSSSGYETTPSYDTDAEYTSMAQELNDQNNPQMLPNGKIVPLELRLLPVTLKNENVRTIHDYRSALPFDGSRPDSSSDDSDSYSNIKRVTLYVQSHSEIVLILFLHEHMANESCIQSLVRVTLFTMKILFRESVKQKQMS